MHRVCLLFGFRQLLDINGNTYIVIGVVIKFSFFLFNRCQLPGSDKINPIYLAVERLLHLDSFYSQVIL